VTAKATKPRGPTLLELADHFDALFRRIEAVDGELTPELAAELEALDFAEASKVDGYRFRRLTQDAEAQHLKDQAKALLERAKRIAAAGERLDARLSAYMALKGVTELKGHSYTAKKLPASSVPLEILVPIDALPERFLRRKDPEPDKVAMKAAMQEGVRPEDWPADELRDEEGKVIARLGEPSIYVRWY
jgi:hypothetical protein